MWFTCLGEPTRYGGTRNTWMHACDVERQPGLKVCWRKALESVTEWLVVATYFSCYTDWLETSNIFTVHNNLQNFCLLKNLSGKHKSQTPRSVCMKASLAQCASWLTWYNLTKLNIPSSMWFFEGIPSWYNLVFSFLGKDIEINSHPSLTGNFQVQKL